MVLFLRKKKLRLVLFPWRRRGRTADPILSIQNPIPTRSSNNDLLSVETLPISSPDNVSPAASPAPENVFAVAISPVADDHELGCDDDGGNVDVMPPELHPVEVIISMDEATYSFTDDREEMVESFGFADEISEPNYTNLVEGHLMKEQTSVDEEIDEEEEHEVVVVVTLKIPVAAGEGKWIKHYCSHHRILLVGEGDFSFSACLAKAFDRAPSMVATSLDSLEFLQVNYRLAALNIHGLISRGCLVMHEVDCTKMLEHASLGHLKFDRIIFNFPFAGLFRKLLSRQNALQTHRLLVSEFMKNAMEMISENGEIHITHKTNGFHGEWDLESMASSHGLRLIEAVEFDLEDYPGYHNKYGFGGDKDFNWFPSQTYKFGL